MFEVVGLKLKRSQHFQHTGYSDRGVNAAVYRPLSAPLSPNSIPPEIWFVNLIANKLRAEKKIDKKSCLQLVRDLKPVLNFS